jgi:hypothetical protein
VIDRRTFSKALGLGTGTTAASLAGLAAPSWMSFSCLAADLGL